LKNFVKFGCFGVFLREKMQNFAVFMAGKTPPEPRFIYGFTAVMVSGRK
jgi:hypothetical protein